MRWMSLVVAAVIGTSLLAADEKVRTLRFGKDDIGKTPVGWKADQTGKGKGSEWKVVTDATAPSKTGHVLAQTAVAPGAVFNVCVVDNINLRDVEVRVAVKAVKGDKDQGGGIVWRYQDANNYYVARVNPLEENLRLYVVTSGKRVQLATKEKLKMAVGKWHSIKIKQVGSQIECYLDDKKELEAKNDGINKAGKVGLWTKGDAQSNFDNLVIQDLGK